MKTNMKIKEIIWHENVPMTGVESLERDEGGNKYIYYELKYVHLNILQNILEDILEPSKTF